MRSEQRGVKISALLLRLAGWKLTLSTPNYPKQIICVAPHTSNWDFILCELAYWSVGRRAGFLMKQFWFFWPLGPIFRALGGIPVGNKQKGSITQQLIHRFNTEEDLTIAITPEGTRSRTSKWRTGFLQVAYQTGVPVTLAVLDFAHKHIFLTETFTPSGNLEADMKAIKAYYSQYQGKYPEKCSTDDE